MSRGADEFPSRFGAGGGMRDDFDDLKAQMARERDAFFRDSDLGGGGFSPWPRGRTSFSGFPTGGRNSYSRAEEEGQSGRMPGNVNDGNWDSDTIPINVRHESSRAKPKYTYAGDGTLGGRHTTEIPVSSQSREPTGPRQERARSEPPGKLNSRLNLNLQPSYSTIPENSEGNTAAQVGKENLYGGVGRRPHPGGGLAPSSGIMSSASAPSVPESRRSPSRPDGVGVRHETAPSMSNGAAGGHQAPPPLVNSSANVRHIPIFVEGRREPIFNTGLPSAAAAGASSSANSAPPSSTNVPPSAATLQREEPRGGFEPHPPVFSRQGPFTTRTSMSGDGPHSVPIRTSGTHPAPPSSGPLQEPTTPQGPPPGPIPMGYSPLPASSSSYRTEPEPTTPLGPPPGPIPMGYLPSTGNSISNPGQGEPNTRANQMHTAASKPAPPVDVRGAPQQPLDELTSPLVPPEGPIPLPCDPNLGTNNQPPYPPARNKSSSDAVAGNQARKQPTDAADAKTSQAQQPAAPAGQDASADKQQNVNFIPIKVKHEDPKTQQQQTQQPASSNRQPSPNNNRSSSPAAQGSGAAANSAPQQPKSNNNGNTNPKIMKLEKTLTDAETLHEQIQHTSSMGRRDKEYLYLEDALEKLLLTLDCIDHDGDEGIKTLRKKAVNKVQGYLNLLESKAADEDQNKTAASEGDAESGDADSETKKS